MEVNVGKVVAVSFDDLDLVLVFFSEDGQEVHVEMTYLDFVWVLVPVICTLVFVVVPETSLDSFTWVFVLVFWGVSDEEDWTLEFEMPNWVEY